MEPESMKWLAVGLAASVGFIGPALGLGLIGFSALQGIARNPEASGLIQTNMILMSALTEAVAIYALIIAILLAMVL